VPTACRVVGSAVNGLSGQVGSAVVVQKEKKNWCFPNRCCASKEKKNMVFSQIAVVLQKEKQIQIGLSPIGAFQPWKNDSLFPL
jgi:hypothetical protein